MIHEHTTPPGSPGDALGRVHENPRALGFKLLLRAVKEALPIEKLADDLGARLGRSGKGMRGRCPVHGGQGRDAFAVYPGEGRWHCFHCNEGGDVLDLYERARGYYDSKAALIDLAGEYDVERPKRPPRWHARQGEKDWKRDELRRVRARHYRRRFLRMFAEDLALIQDPAEREQAALAIYADLDTLATACAINREGARGE